MERVLAESMPIVATGKFDLLDMVVLLSLVAPSEHHSLDGREHGRTITLAEVRDRMWERQGCAVSCRSRDDGIEPRGSTISVSRHYWVHA